MSTRSFIVFQDEPSEPIYRPNASRRSEPPAPLPAVSGSVLHPIPALSTQEKENLHPVTGARAASNGDLQTKKRKNSVLATKLHVPPATKKQKDHSAEPKKRKPLGGSSKSKANAGLGRKEGKGAAPSRSAGRSGLLRKVAPMPKVDEEVADVEVQDQGQDQDKLSHAEVDSKCYDLTVSPLADVSKAFDQVPSSAESELSRAGESKENNDELPIISQGKSAVASLKKRSSPSKSKSFSTPERKRIYSAFTFSSPSPSSQRFNASRGTGLDLFGDIEFKPA